MSETTSPRSVDLSLANIASQESILHDENLPRVLQYAVNMGYTPVKFAQIINNGSNGCLLLERVQDASTQYAVITSSQIPDQTVFALRQLT